MVVFCQVYGWITPYNELKLVREGNVAPAISFGGALIGFILPLHSAITHSVGFIDMLIWAAVAMVVQLAVFATVRLFFKGLVREIEKQPNRLRHPAGLLLNCHRHPQRGQHDLLIHHVYEPTPATLISACYKQTGPFRHTP